MTLLRTLQGNPNLMPRLADGSRVPQNLAKQLEDRIVPPPEREFPYMFACKNQRGPQFIMGALQIGHPGIVVERNA